MFEELLLPQNLVLIALVGGILIKICLILGKRLFEKSTWFFIGGLALLSLVVSFKSGVHNYLFSVISSFLFFTIVTAIIFLKEDIMTKLSEIKLLLFSLAMTYFVGVVFGIGVVLVIPIIFLGAVLFFCFSSARPGFKTKLLLYVYYLLCLLFIIIIIIGPKLLTVIFMVDPTNLGISPIETFFLGMSLFTLLAISLYLFMLFPIPAKHESFSSALHRAKENAQEMVAKFDETDSKIPALIAIILIVGGGLAVNLVINSLNMFTIAIIILFLSEVIDFLSKQPPATTTVVQGA